MSTYSIQLRLLLKRIILLVLVYQISRLSFLLANLQSFSSVEFQSFIAAFLWGMRFDLVVILTANILFILFHIIPGNRFFNRGYQAILKWMFFIVNIPLILLNSIDLEYFKFQGKRTTADLFHLFGMGEDMKNTIPQMAIDFWQVLLVFFLISIILVLSYNRIKIPVFKRVGKINPWTWAFAVLVAGCVFVGTRGGFQYKPLGIMAAARLTSPQLVPLVLNTPFTVLRTLGKSLIEEKIFFEPAEAKKLFDKDHRLVSEEPFIPLNVAIIILESFSSEYISAFNNGHGYTPFLDSLMKEGMTFSNAFANAKKSIDGIPAVVASMPTLMPASYISSPYNSNFLKSIAAILGDVGYSSAFFHGGNNGTMNFDNFTLMTGFEKYYGRREYPGDDYDGSWGVYDENFYYFFIDKCNEMQKPFVNTFFSLSSHHPYSIPDHLTGKFKKGPMPIHESIGYADYALMKFFEKAKTTDWYKNTLFVITSDHTGPAETSYYNTKSGMFRVPIVFYHPGSNLKGWSERVTQQTDIIPGILDYLNFKQPFTSFGNSMFDSTKTPFAVNYPGDVYQITGTNFLLQFDGNDVVSAYDYRNDSLLVKNVYAVENPEQTELTKILKAVIQEYNSALINNRLTPLQPLP